MGEHIRSPVFIILIIRRVYLSDFPVLRQYLVSFLCRHNWTSGLSFQSIPDFAGLGLNGRVLAVHVFTAFLDEFRRKLVPFFSFDILLLRPEWTRI